LYPVLLHVLAVVFVATLIRSAFGFGEALIAVPLLAITVPVEIAAPLAALVSITVAAVVVIQDWRNIHFQSAGWLVFSTLLGIPLGLALLVRVDEHLVKALLAILIVAVATYFRFGRNRLQLQKDNRGWPFGCGFCAGVLGRAYGNEWAAAGDGTMRRWSP
jgi:uncharacterized membrane protein YfcA